VQLGKKKNQKKIKKYKNIYFLKNKKYQKRIKKNKIEKNKFYKKIYF
jgi:hypothetical protein